MSRPPAAFPAALSYSEHVPNLLASYERFGGLNISDSHNMAIRPPLLNPSKPIRLVYPHYRTESLGSLQITHLS